MNQPTTPPQTEDPLAKLNEFATKVCKTEVDVYKRRGLTTPSQALCYGEGMCMGFVAAFVTRHYFRANECGFDDVLEEIKARHPELHRVFEQLLEGDDDGDEDLAEMFDAVPTEHESDEDDPA